MERKQDDGIWIIDADANLTRNGGQMALNSSTELSSVALRSNDRMKLAIIGIGVIFASLGLGEAVYRFAFRDFDGATDRLPIEMLFGLSFAWMATKLAGIFTNITRRPPRESSSFGIATTRFVTR